eukprot:TRINITY_DN21737_c0_g1_i1.p1 TRINITY_DN21737_c0_g1~~TRINITY_DN21737_c0_g1_i1.p1  ORF type:complete len:243 (-),score=1.24 TRINITY_DN21737_c0_g1_i1:56-784(-)
MTSRLTYYFTVLLYISVFIVLCQADCSLLTNCDSCRSNINEDCAWCSGAGVCLQIDGNYTLNATAEEFCHNQLNGVLLNETSICPSEYCGDLGTNCTACISDETCGFCNGFRCAEAGLQSSGCNQLGGTLITTCPIPSSEPSSTGASSQGTTTSQGSTVTSSGSSSKSSSSAEPIYILPTTREQQGSSSDVSINNFRILGQTMVISWVIVASAVVAVCLIGGAVVACLMRASRKKKRGDDYF